MSSKRRPRPRGRSLIALTGALSACSFVDLGGYSSGAPIVNDGGPTDDASRPEPGPGEGGATEPETGASEHPYVLAVRADAPVSWYRFEEDADANIARDEISGHDATVIGGAMGFGAEGIAGRGLACDGTGSGFDVGDVYDFDGKTPFTLELWIRPTPTRTEQRVIRKRREETPLLGYVLYLTPDTNVAFEDWGVNLSAWTETPLPTAFTHLVVTVAYAGGTGNAKLWIDGQPQSHGGFDNTENAPNTNQPLRLLESFKGAVDELAIYDRALSATRILEHYRAGKLNAAGQARGFIARACGSERLPTSAPARTGAASGSGNAGRTWPCHAVPIRMRKHTLIRKSRAIRLRPSPTRLRRKSCVRIALLVVSRLSPSSASL